MVARGRGVGCEENGEMMDKGNKLPVLRWSSLDLMYNTMIVVNNKTVLCTWKLLRVLSHVWLCGPMDSISLGSSACQSPLSIEFSRQEYWSMLPLPTLGDLSDPEIKPASLVSPTLAGRFFTTNVTWENQVAKSCCCSATESCPTLRNPVVRE